MKIQLFSPSYIQKLARVYHLHPRSAYGQHFLISEIPIGEMLHAADIKHTDTVIEIGPGFGVLTFALAEKAEKVIAFEIEKKLQPYWEEKQKEYSNVEIVWGNALKNLRTVNCEFRTRYKVVANIPYQITSELIRTFLESTCKPSRIVLMAQKEVAERISASPGKMSLLSVSVQFYGKARIVSLVPRNFFWPEPKVDSAIIEIVPFQKTADDPEKFFRVVRAGFSNKRKQLWRNLSMGLHIDKEKVKSALREVVGSDTVRAEELGVEEWIQFDTILFS